MNDGLIACMEALPIPQRVDLLRYRTISNDELRNHINREGKVLYARE